MSQIKHLLFLIITALCSVSVVIGQANETSQNSDEMSIEESYLQEAIEMMIIRESSRSDSMEQKLLALEYIGSALERGSTNEEIRATLELLSVEGTQNKVMQGRRVANNYPLVRRQAAKYLGTLGTKEAKTALLKMCSSENEPMVLQEAIKSLGAIGINDNNDVVNSIVWIANKYHNTDHPDNLLALSAIDALDKIAVDNKQIDTGAIQLLAKIMEGPYVLPVRERARQVLINLRQNGLQGGSQESGDNQETGNNQE